MHAGKNNAEETHWPDDLSRHVTVVQVHFDNVVPPQQLQGELTARRLLKLRIHLLDKRSKVKGQPQHLNNKHTRTRSSYAVMISCLSKFGASASPVTTEWTIRCGWPLGCAGATCFCTGDLLGVGRGQRWPACPSVLPVPGSPAGCTLTAAPPDADLQLPKSRWSWTGLPADQTKCQCSINVGTWQVQKATCCWRFSQSQLDL